MQLLITIFYTGSPVTSSRSLHISSARSQPIHLTPAVRRPSCTPMQHKSLSVPLLKFNAYVFIQQTEKQIFSITMSRINHHIIKFPSKTIS
jgi:hypothetical protein